MEGIYWGLGVLFALWASSSALLWASNARTFEELRKLGERMSKQESMMEPWWDICKKSVPEFLQLHHSPDVLAEALEGEPDEEKIRIAEELVRTEINGSGDQVRSLVLCWAQWLLSTRRRQLEMSKAPPTKQRQSLLSWLWRGAGRANRTRQ